MDRLHKLCIGFDHSQPPRLYEILGVENELVSIRKKVGDEKAKKFGGSIRKKIERKMEEARQHRLLRGDTKIKKTMAECDREAQLAVGEEYNKEANSLEEYDLYDTLLESLDRAIYFAGGAASAVRNQETSSHA